MPKYRRKATRKCRTCHQHHNECLCNTQYQLVDPGMHLQGYNRMMVAYRQQRELVTATTEPPLYPSLHQSYEEVTDLNGYQEGSRPLLLALIQRHQLVGRVHTVVVVSCNQRGLVLDMVVADSSGQAPIEAEEPICEYDDLPGLADVRQAPHYVLRAVLLPWCNLPNSISALPMDLRIHSTMSYICPTSTFKVYISSLDPVTSQPVAKMANRASPVIHLPSFINKTLAFGSFSASDLVQCRSPIARPRFLVIMDFEATCDFAPEPVVNSYNSEIIEFPWVVLDTLTLEIVHEDRVYVRPDFMDGVTRYCSSLTGITKEDCEVGVTLAEAVEKFDGFVRQCLFRYGENNFRIVTDSVWDLQVQLRMEAQRKDISLAWWYQEFFDLRQEFRQFYAWFPFLKRGPPIAVMLTAFDMEFVGRHHSGLDDCKSISQVIRVLLQLHPNTFTQPRVIPLNYDPMTDSSWCSFMSHCPPDAWLCPNEDCSVYNRPHLYECRFCQTSRH